MGCSQGAWGLVSTGGECFYRWVDLWAGELGNASLRYLLLWGQPNVIPWTQHLPILQPHQMGLRDSLGCTGGDGAAARGHGHELWPLDKLGGGGLGSQQRVEGTIGTSCLLLPLPSLHPGFYRGDGVPKNPTLPQPLGLTLHEQHALRCAPDTRA